LARSTSASHCGDQHQRQSCNVLQADIGRGGGAIFFVHRGVFGIAARLVADAAVIEKYRVALFETRYRAADLFHGARAVAAEYRGQFVRIINRLGT